MYEIEEVADKARFLISSVTQSQECSGGTRFSYLFCAAISGFGEARGGGALVNSSEQY